MLEIIRLKKKKKGITVREIIQQIKTDTIRKLVLVLHKLNLGQGESGTNNKQ